MKFFGNLLGAKRGGLCGKEMQVGPFSIKIGEAFAEGGYGSIYHATDRTTGEAMALKHVMIMDSSDIRECIQKEISILETLRGQQSIVRLHAHCFVGQKESEAAFLLMEYCPRSLVEHLTTSNVSEEEKLAIFAQVCQGIATMHAESPPATHRDVKAENVLQQADGHWCLCDFGSTSFFEGQIGSHQVLAQQETQIQRMTTPAYRAPELWNLYLGQRIGPKSDVWALGCLLYWMLTNGQRLPFDNASQVAVHTGQFSPPPGASPAAKSLVEAALRVSVDERPDAFTMLTLVEAAMRNPGAPATARGAPAAASHRRGPSDARPAPHHPQPQPQPHAHVAAAGPTRPAPAAQSRPAHDPGAAGPPQAGPVRRAPASAESAQPAARRAQAPARATHGGSFWSMDISASVVSAQNQSDAGQPAPAAPAPPPPRPAPAAQGPIASGGGSGGGSSVWAMLDRASASGAMGVTPSAPAPDDRPGTSPLPPPDAQARPLSASSRGGGAGRVPELRAEGSAPVLGEAQGEGTDLLGVNAAGAGAGTAHEAAPSKVPGTATPPRPASSASRPVDPFLSAPSPPPAPSHGPVDGHLRGRRPPVVPGTDSPSKPGSRSRSPQLHRTHGAPSYAQQHAAHHTAAGQPAPVAWPGGPGRDAVEAMAQRVRGLTSDERDELLTRAVLEHQQLTQLVADLQARLMRQGALLAQLVPSTGAGPGAAPVAAVAGGAHSLHATFPPPSAHPPAPAVPVIVPPPHVAAPMPPGVVLGAAPSEPRQVVHRADSGVAYDALSGFEGAGTPSRRGGDGQQSVMSSNGEGEIDYMPMESSGGLRATPTQALRNMMAERRHRRVRSDLPGPPAKGGSYQHF